MGRILALDIGKKRTGIAVSDPTGIIATALATVETNELIGYLKKYMATEQVTTIIAGYPLNLDGSPTDGTPIVEKFITKFGNVFPDLPVTKVDERFSSKLASGEISKMGLRKSEKEEKGLIDSVAAVLLLQDFLRHQG
ncbi:MAG: Holliday junction resolvase RuvX [Chitinophagia bacterium]|nr:Holliday junction resolvase RuvX [Chitinophagia bacterium]